MSDLIEDDFFSHDVLDVAKSFELLHQAAALLLDSAEVLDFLGEFVDSVVSHLSDSVALLSKVTDDFLKFPAVFL